MRKRGILAGTILLAVCLAGCASGAGRTEMKPEPLSSAEPHRTAVTLYYRDSCGYIVPMVRRLWSMEDIAEETLYAQTASAGNCGILAPLGLTPVLDRELEFKAAIMDGVARVDIAGDTFGSKDAKTEKDMVDCIVNSLCSLKGVNGVTLTVDGKSVKTLPEGTDVSGVLVWRPINVINEDAKREAACTLYYVSEQSGLICPVTMRYGTLPKLEEAVRAMIEPKAAYKLATMFPQDCRLIDSSVREGVATLNFSREFSFLGEYPELESRVLVALNSVCRELAHADTMKITVEGMEYRPVLNFWPEDEAVSAFNMAGEEYDAY